ncbi:MAG: fatty acid--CoA ligase family protein [Pseudoruegeria sp.]
MKDVINIPKVETCEALLKHLVAADDNAALIQSSGATSYARLCEMISNDRELLRAQGVAGAAVLFVSEFSARNISLLISLWLENNVVALSMSRQPDRVQTLSHATGAAFVISVSDETNVEITEQIDRDLPPNVATLINAKEPGFVVFSSGTTGPAKGVVHRLQPFLERYQNDADVGTMLAFMSFDHIGGLATLFHVLLTHGTLVIPDERSPQELGRCIDKYSVNTLHVSPTLLNLVLVSGTLEGRNIQSLRKVYFGSEPMSLVVLDRVRTRLPGVELIQLYGMSETGVLPCSNKPNENTWLQVQTPGYSVEVIDGVCNIRSKTLMLGYLTDEDSLPRDTLFSSGDMGEVEGTYFRISGRKMHLINVGGINVSPTDVEQVIETCDNIADVSVSGADSPILGQVVAASVVLKKPETLSELKARLYREIKGKLTPEQIPRVVTISEIPLYSERFKKKR